MIIDEEPMSNSKISAPLAKNPPSSFGRAPVKYFKKKDDGITFLVQKE